MRAGFACLAVALVLLPPSANAQWIPVEGPYGGYVKAIASVGGTMIAGTYGGGIYRSIDHGQHWTVSNAGLGSMYVQAMLVNEKKAPRNYDVTFDASGLASGVYLYRLTAGQYVESRNILMK
jgi:hypothetical protein